MGERDHKPEKWDQPGLRGSEDDLGRALDAALASYAAVEPRMGLEERILANLQSGQARSAERLWWPWGLAGAVAVIVLVAVALGWRAKSSVPPVVVRHLPAIQQNQNESSAPAVADLGHDGVHNLPGPGLRAHPAAPIETTAVNPKLDVFPSPQPLSEQEKVLFGYVARNPERAALIAEARMEQLRRDEEDWRANDALNDSAFKPNR